MVLLSGFPMHGVALPGPRKALWIGLIALGGGGREEFAKPNVLDGGGGCRLLAWAVSRLCLLLRQLAVGAQFQGRMSRSAG